MRVRKIVMSRTAHNSAAMMLLAVCLSGCGGQQGQDHQTSLGHSTPAETCPLVISDHALAQIDAVATRVEAGEEVSLDEMVQIFDSPVYELWRRSYLPERISPQFMGRMLFIALRGAENLPENLQKKKQRIDIVRNFEESRNRRQEIADTVARLRDDEVLCRVFDELRGWIPESEMPDSLHVDLVLGYPEIRLLEGHVMVDASLAWAAGMQQLPRFIAVTLYKDRADIDGPQPKDVKGENILLESLRLVRNLVAPAMIEHTDSVVFDRRHALLGGRGPDPLDIYGQAHRTLESLDRGLTRVRQAETTTDEDWLQLYRLFIGAQSWQATGWYMGQIIEERLGLGVLQESLDSVAGIFVTYHQACLTRPDESDALEGSLEWYRDRPARLSADNVAWLEAKLNARFGS